MDDNFSGAYMIPKYNPAVARAFDYAIICLLFLPIGGELVSNINPADFEALARARSFLAENLSRDEPLVMKHTKIFNLVEVDVEYDPSRVSYTQATPKTIHKGAYHPSKGRNDNTPITHVWMTPAFLRLENICPVLWLLELSHSM